MRKQCWWAITKKMKSNVISSEIKCAQSIIKVIANVFSRRLLHWKFRLFWVTSRLLSINQPSRACPPLPPPLPEAPPPHPPHPSRTYGWNKYASLILTNQKCSCTTNRLLWGKGKKSDSRVRQSSSLSGLVWEFFTGCMLKTLVHH